MLVSMLLWSLLILLVARVLVPDLAVARRCRHPRHQARKRG
jgi:hypothetical protein